MRLLAFALLALAAAFARLRAGDGGAAAALGRGGRGAPPRRRVRERRRARRAGRSAPRPRRGGAWCSTWRSSPPSPARTTWPGARSRRMSAWWWSGRGGRCRARRSTPRSAPTCRAWAWTRMRSWTSARCCRRWCRPRPSRSLPAENTTLDAATGRFSATLVVLAEGMPTVRMRLAGRAVPTQPAVVATRRIGLGEVVGPADARLVRLRAERVRPGTAQRLDQVVGQQLRRPMTAEMPFASADLAAPAMVEKNALVTMVLEAPGLSLSVQGRALEAAPRGAVVPVMNLASRSVVEGEVIGPGRVRVPMGAAPLAAHAARSLKGVRHHAPPLAAARPAAASPRLVARRLRQPRAHLARRPRAGDVAGGEPDRRSRLAPGLHADALAAGRARRLQQPVAAGQPHLSPRPARGAGGRRDHRARLHPGRGAAAEPHPARAPGQRQARHAADLRHADALAAARRQPGQRCSTPPARRPATATAR